jgi:hypothetical protein
MYIELFGRGDRLGANITSFIAQINYAVNNNLFILYNKINIKDGDDVNYVPYNQQYNNSIFILSLFYFIDVHNNNLLKKGFSYGELYNVFTIHWFEMMSKVLININMDYYTFFKINIYPTIYEFYLNYSIKNGYINLVPFNKDKTILVHLRLGDCKHSPDYEGKYCADYFKDKINNKEIANNNTHYEIKQKYPHNNFQAPLSSDKINNQIDKILHRNLPPPKHLLAQYFHPINIHKMLLFEIYGIRILYDDRF